MYWSWNLNIGLEKNKGRQFCEYRRKSGVVLLFKTVISLWCTEYIPKGCLSVFHSAVEYTGLKMAVILFDLHEYPVISTNFFV